MCQQVFTGMILRGTAPIQSLIEGGADRQRHTERYTERPSETERQTESQRQRETERYLICRIIVSILQIRSLRHKNTSQLVRCLVKSERGRRALGLTV